MLCNKCGARLRNKKCPRCGWEPFRRKRKMTKQEEKYWEKVFGGKIHTKEKSP